MGSTLYGHAKECNRVIPSARCFLPFVLHPLICMIRDSFSLSLNAWYLDDGTIVGDTLVVRKVLELTMKDGPGCGLHLKVDKTEVFWPKEDPRSRLTSIFPPNIARPLHGVKLLYGPASVDFNFCNELVMKLMAKTIVLIDAIANINDPQCEFMALRSSMKRIVNASRPGFGDWKWRLATLPFAFGGLGVNFVGDVLNFSFLALRLQSAGLQTTLPRHTGIVESGPSFDDALSMFNISMETNLLCNPSEIAAPKLMKKMADIYFRRVTKNADPQHMALQNSQREDHTSDWLRAVPISGLGQTMNAKTYRCVLCYRLGIPLFSVSKPCSACSRVFNGDIYGDHDVSCASIVGIKHRHNVVRDTLVDICYCSGISAGKEVDIGLDGGVTNHYIQEICYFTRGMEVLMYVWI
ncbi:hypothetical protein Tco_1085017 [Tanacetum coccineum]